MAPKKSRGPATFIDSTKYSLIEGLTLSDATTSSPEWQAAQRAREEGLVREAVHRGASEFDLIGRLERRHGRGPGSSSLTPDADSILTSMNVEAVWEASSRMRDIARAELESLPDRVRKSFDSDPSTPKELVRPRLDNYVGMRAVLYQLGYDDPCDDIFRRISKDGDLIGHTIQCGVHEVVVERLSGLRPLLRSWGGDDLVEETARGISGVFGFVPRFIAPKAGEKSTVFSLSNHALGLAIDIDAGWNPHIKEPEVVAAIREATGADFGKAFTDMGDDVPADGRVIEIHRNAQKASDALQKWLRQYLTLYLEMERRRTARASYEDAINDGETDHNMRLLKKIMKHHKPAQLTIWMEKGVSSIPLALAAAMMELGFRWGNAYKSSKDGMHFELLPCSWRRCSASCRDKQHILRPDGPPRLLDDVLVSIAH